MNMINPEKEINMLFKMKKRFNYTIGDKIHFIMEDSTPIRKTKHKDTIFYYLKARVITRNNKKIPAGKHTVQIPGKTVYYQLYYMLKDSNRLDDKNILITIIKNHNKDYNIELNEITLHKAIT